MRSYWTDATATFEMSDGREFECKYSYRTTLGNYSGLPENSYPDEVEVGDPEFYIDGEYVTEKDLPKGLPTIANALYENGDSDLRFKYREQRA